MQFRYLMDSACARLASALAAVFQFHSGRLQFVAKPFGLDRPVMTLVTVKTQRL